MIRVGFPSRLVRVRCLIAPHIPTWAYSTGKKLKARANTASLNKIIQLIGFFRMLSFHTANDINLTASRLFSPVIFPSNTKEDKLCDITEIKPYTSSIGKAIFSYLFPNEIGFIIESPRFHNCQSFGKQSIRNPEI